jgi:hypothetical protein
LGTQLATGHTALCVAFIFTYYSFWQRHTEQI